ncbi:hypothetical protein [Alteromonas stellipolaris]|uniref:hypothetical protein n=1 Tax=Alteromonas stellipolaris TaxID=233316 RepID=UPI001DA48623|nr:hypothetical protein [Alteromonas stellipolaris]MBZ2163328.1 hypothetical protein [Alteromonas stellipolaris]
MIRISEEKLSLYFDLKKALKILEEDAYKYMASIDNRFGIAPLELLETKGGRIVFIMLINEILRDKGDIK